METVAPIAPQPARPERTIKERADGWSNVLTGLGTILDKRTKSEVSWDVMSEQDAENLFSGDDVAAAVVTCLPEDALRQGIKFTSEVANQGELIDKAFDALHLVARCRQAWEWGRLYGGCGLLMNVDDSADLSEPLDVNRVRELKGFTPFTRHELRYQQIEQDVNSSMYGRPVTYQLQPRRGTILNGVSAEIHHTRLLIFEGSPLPVAQYVTNGYWADSVLNRIKNSVANYQTANDSVALILQEFNQGVFKIKGLAEMLRDDQDQDVMKRFTIMQLVRSVVKGLVIDGDEDFSNVGAAVTGVADLLDRVERRMVTAGRMPHTKLLGQSPSGLGATGNSEQTNWRDTVSNGQELVLRPNIERALEVLMRSRKGPTNGVFDKTLRFEFNPLEQPSEIDTANARNIQSKTDEVYITNGVVTPEEIAVSRFAGGKYSMETVINFDEREKQPAELDTDPEKQTPPGGDKP